MKNNLKNIIIILVVYNCIGNISFVSDLRASESQILPPTITQSQTQTKSIVPETTWLHDLINAFNKIFGIKVSLGKKPVETPGEEGPRTIAEPASTTTRPAGVEVGTGTPDQPQRSETGVGTEEPGTTAQGTQTDEPVEAGATTETPGAQTEKSILTPDDRQLLINGERLIVEGVSAMEYSD